MEAAFVVTPIESHHSLSVYLSEHGIHNLVETSFCSMLAQAHEMIRVAREHDVTLRVAENFFRFPVDRFAQTLKRSGYVGRIGRIFSYNDHAGYHNNSRWIAFAGGHPVWVQAIEHTIPTAEFNSTPERFHKDEIFTARFFMFPGDQLVVDQMSGNVKGHLGRQPRPGYTEWHGERGALVHRALDAWKGTTELRYCSDAVLGPWRPDRWNGGVADKVFPVQTEYDGRDRWTRTWCDTSVGRLEHVNPFRPEEPSRHIHREYGSCIMGHIVDFALAVRGLQPSEFDDGDAMMSMMMEAAVRESSSHEGQRLKMPLAGELESDARERERLTQKYKVDPMDVEAMLTISYPKP